MMTQVEKFYDATSNRDPITGAPGSHPVGTGIGAALGGAAAGAVVGTTAGPAGTLLGAALGAIVGGLAGKSVAESVDPTTELAYWREGHDKAAHVTDGGPFDWYAPAYRYGVDTYIQFPTCTFDELESELARGWPLVRGDSDLEWASARGAARAAWLRMALRQQH